MMALNVELCTPSVKEKTQAEFERVQVLLVCMTTEFSASSELVAEVEMHMLEGHTRVVSILFAGFDSRHWGVLHHLELLSPVGLRKCCAKSDVIQAKVRKQVHAKERKQAQADVRKKMNDAVHADVERIVRMLVEKEVRTEFHSTALNQVTEEQQDKLREESEDNVRKHAWSDTLAKKI